MRMIEAVQELTVGAGRDEHQSNFASIPVNPGGMEALAPETLAGGATLDCTVGHDGRYAGTVSQASNAWWSRIP